MVDVAKNWQQIRVYKPMHQGIYRDEEFPINHYQYRCMSCRTAIPLANITGPLDGLCPRCKVERRYMKVGDSKPISGIRGVLPENPEPPPGKFANGKLVLGWGKVIEK